MEDAGMRAWPSLLGVVLLAGHALLYAGALQQKAWNILRSGVADKDAKKRVDAVRALSLLPRDVEAMTMAEKALVDTNPSVRAAAALALGDMGSRASIPKLSEALSDKDPVVMLAAAHSLVAMHDHKGYDAYYAVLTSQRRAGRGLIAEQREMLSDRKKLAEFGVETGLGLVPFAGIGLSAYRMMGKNGSDEIRAAAAQVLAKDPDPQSENALTEAASDHSDVVRIAALKAIATRGDPRLLESVEPSMDDEKDAVRYMAAGAVIRLTHGSRVPRLRSEKHQKIR